MSISLEEAEELTKLVEGNCLDKEEVRKKLYRLKQLCYNNRFQKFEFQQQIELIEKELGLED